MDATEETREGCAKGDLSRLARDRLRAEHGAARGGQCALSGVLCGEGADGGAGAGEAVAPGGAQVLREGEGLNRIGVTGRDLGGCRSAVELAEEGDEAADDGAIGFATEGAEAVADFADEVDEGDATANAVGVDALSLGEGRKFFGAVDDGAEAFLGIVDDGEIIDEVGKFFSEGHGRGAGREGGRGRR